MVITIGVIAQPEDRCDLPSGLPASSLLTRSLTTFRVVTMVASFSALGAHAKTLNTTAIANYFADYVAHGTDAGCWFGKGAEALSLQNPVTKEALRNLLAGRHPRRNCPLVQIQRQQGQPENNRPPGSRESKKRARRRDRSPGFDLCLNVPSSVSYFAAVGGAEVLRTVEECAEVAGRSVLDYVERNLGLARRGRGGAQRERAGLVVARFLHLVNRNLSPQIHLHCVFANACQRDDGSWVTVDGRLLADWTRTLGPIFRCTLARELQSRLGLILYRPKKSDGRDQSWFEIAGIPRQLSLHWANRRPEIEKLLQGEGLSLTNTTAQAREHATLASRKPKLPTPPRQELLVRWATEAKRFRFDQERARSLLHRAKPPSRSPERTLAKVLAKVLREHTSHEAHFTARQFVQEVCEAMQAKGLDGVTAAERAQVFLELSPEVVRLNAIQGERRYTSRSLWESESRLLADVAAMRSRAGAVVPDQTIDKVIRRRRQLSPEQAQAARQLLSQKQAIRILSGVAGAGKSTTLDAIRDGLERGGYTVIGGALAGAAKEELVRKTGIASRTVASYLYHLDKSTWQAFQDRIRHDAKQMVRAFRGQRTYKPTRLKLTSRHVLILDEAGMLDTRSMERIAHHVQRAGATLILAGDAKQLPPIMAGGLFPHLKATQEGSELRQNQRQRDPADQKAVQDIRSGRTAQALENYARRGRVTIGANRQDAIRKLVQAWAENGGARRPHDHSIFTQTREEAAFVNRLCQAERRDRGMLRSFASIRVDNERFYIGDRVLFHQAYRKAGIENGFRATVVAVNPVLRQITVRLDDAPSVDAKARGLSQTVTVPLRAFKNGKLTLGYSATTHKMQGQTTPHALMLIGGAMTSQELSYVQATRGRLSTRIFVDEAHAGERLRELAKAMQTSHAKTMAHDLGQRQPSPSQHIHLSF